MDDQKPQNKSGQQSQQNQQPPGQGGQQPGGTPPPGGTGGTPPPGGTGGTPPPGGTGGTPPPGGTGGTPPPGGTGGTPPGGAQPPFGGAPGGFQPPPPPKEEDKTPANYQIGQHLPKEIKVNIPVHSLKFDTQIFLHLLAGSISLTKDEKKRIIESIPKLRQEQVDELMRIFEEERRKFAELSQKHVDQLKKLEKQHWADWQDVELEQKAGKKKEEDEADADKIRKQLGL